MTSKPGWLLLIHQIPQNPGCLRVKVWRRLQRVGAIESSVYVLPAVSVIDFFGATGRALAEAALLSADFTHFWAKGPAIDLVRGFGAALDAQRGVRRERQ